jgi:hypothetical protein
VINGVHGVIFSRDAEADRAFFRDVLSLPTVDVGGGWLVFGLPPAELAVHPSSDSDRHELYLMCDDIEAFIAAMAERRIACDPVEEYPWGLLSNLTLPGGGKLGVYEPRHERPENPPLLVGSSA